MASLIRSIFTQTCPRCRSGKLFSVRNPYKWKTMQTMPHECEVCGQDFVIEPGFFFGASYISYALNIAWLIPTFLFVRFVLDYEYSTFIIVMFLMLPILVPIIFRVSRSAWIHIFVKYDASVKRNTRT